MGNHTSQKKSEKPQQQEATHTNHVCFQGSPARHSLGDFSALPTELLFLISHHCSFEDLVNLSRTSKGLFILTSHNDLWLPLYNQTQWLHPEDWVKPSFTYQLPPDQWVQMDQNRTHCCWKKQYLSKTTQIAEESHRLSQLIREQKAALQILEHQRITQRAQITRELQLVESRVASLRVFFQIFCWVFSALLVWRYFSFFQFLDKMLWDIYSIPATLSYAFAIFWMSRMDLQAALFVLCLVLWNFSTTRDSRRIFLYLCIFLPFSSIWFWVGWLLLYIKTLLLRPALVVASLVGYFFYVMTYSNAAVMSNAVQSKLPIAYNLIHAQQKATSEIAAINTELQSKASVVYRRLDQLENLSKPKAAKRNPSSTATENTDTSCVLQ